VHVLLEESGPRGGLRDPERPPHPHRAVQGGRRRDAGRLLHGGPAGRHPADPQPRHGDGAGGRQAPAGTQVCEHRGVQEQTRTLQEPGERGECAPAQAQERPGRVQLHPQPAEEREEGEGSTGEVYQTRGGPSLA